MREGTGVPLARGCCRRREIVDLSKQEVDGIVAAVNNRTAAEWAGVDTSAIEQVDPSSTTRPSAPSRVKPSIKVREARRLQNTQESAYLLSAQISSEMTNAISGDVASHPSPSAAVALARGRRHLGRGAEVVAGHEEIDVRFSISAAEERTDDRTGPVMACDDPQHCWKNAGDARPTQGGHLGWR
jgi:hypothetical protein